MSYNIDSIDAIHLKDFSIGPRFEELAERAEHEAPEISVFDDDWNIDKGFQWSGDGSGHAFDYLVDTLATFNGEADFVLTWEGGDSHDGLRLRDHVVTRHDVVMALGNEIKP